MEDRGTEPDAIYFIGESIVKVFGPGELTVEERSERWAEVQNVAWNIVNELASQGKYLFFD